MARTLGGVGGSAYQDIIQQAVDRIAPGSTAVTGPFHYIRTPAAVPHQHVRQVRLSSSTGAPLSMAGSDSADGDSVAGP